MKKTFFLSILISFTAFTIPLNAQKRVSANPNPIVIRQSDSTTITILLKGDEHFSYSQTTDGLIVKRNEKGIFEYAQINTNGEIKNLGIKAKDKHNRTKNDSEIVQKIKKTNDSIRHSPKFRSKRLKSSQPTPFKLENSFPTKGKRKVLMLLIQFPDLKSKYSKDSIWGMMNRKNFNRTGSFRDFYLKNSFNKLDLSIDVIGWYTAKKPYLYYAESKNNMDLVRELVQQAIDSAKMEKVDFKKYDNDNNGKVDGIMFIHAGPGAEENDDKRYIWSHSNSLDTTFKRNYDGVTIDDYTIQPETRENGMVGIGVICHEFGHSLGLPDLYDTNSNSEGLGSWCLMASGSWLNNEVKPSDMSAWCKEQMGWITPREIQLNGTYNLNPAHNDSLVYKIRTHLKSEYFLLENRNNIKNRETIAGLGLAIFHIDTTKNNNDIKSNKLVDLEEADGKSDLDNNTNSGDAGDLFPGTSRNTKFVNYSNPNSKTYNNENSNVRITTISISDTVITFHLGDSTNVNISKQITSNKYFKISPNPCHNYFIFETFTEPTNKQFINIRDIYGRICKTETITSNIQNIELNLKSGVYIVEYIFDNQKLSHRIVLL